MYTSIFSSNTAVLVGAFLVKRVRLLQWLVFFFFFSSDHRPHRVCTLFSTDFTRFTVKPAVTGSCPCFSQKLFRAFAKTYETEGSPLSIFFGTVRLFGDFFAFKGSHFKFFDILQQTKVPKNPKGPKSPFKYFGTMRLFKILIFRFFFSKKNCLQRVPLRFF